MTWTKTTVAGVLAYAKMWIDTGEPWCKVEGAVQAIADVDDAIAAVGTDEEHAFSTASTAIAIAANWVPMEVEPTLLEDASGIALAVKNGDLQGGTV